MQRWTSLTLRAAFIVGFLIVLPLMALPSVARFLDRLLYGNAESSVPSAAGTEAVPTPRVKVRADVSRVTHEGPLSPENEVLAENFRIRPPPLRPTPDFSPPADDPIPKELLPGSADVGPLDQAAAQKIDAVRGRLEELGAEYVRLEMSEDGRTFHCLCEMLLEGDAGPAQPFEATRNDPVAAAEAVLANVEKWRNAERTPRPQRGGDRMN